MKIWIDAQLSPAIAAWINRRYENIEAKSVREVGLRDALDFEIFEEAKKQKVVIMSKDGDFIELVEQHGPPPTNYVGYLWKYVQCEIETNSH